jgi:hypothetical protein
MSADRRRARRLALGLWLALAFLVWNARFDYGIRMASSSYIYREQLHLEGRGPAVTIAGIMRPAPAAAARSATLWCVSFALPGLLALAWAARRGR